MAKINKVYPSFFNGVSQQVPELMLDSQCQEMINCVPDLVLGTSKRAPAKHIAAVNTLPVASKVCHVYNRGEDDEEYIFVSTGDVTAPIRIYDKAGNEKTVDFGDEWGDSFGIRTYLTGADPLDIKATTVQDRTFIINKGVEVDIAGESVTDRVFTNEIRFSALTANSTSTVWNATDRRSYNEYDLTVTVKLHVNGTLYTSVFDWHKKTSSRFANGKGGLSLKSECNNRVKALIDALVIDTEVLNVDGDNYKIYTENPVDIFLDATIVQRLTATDKRAEKRVYFNRGNTGQAFALPEAFYWIKKASGDSTHVWRYAVYLDGTKFETTGHESQAVATSLATLINADANYTASAIGSVIKINRTDNANFTFSEWDSWGSQASYGWIYETDKISDLPKKLGWSDKTVKITGGDDSKFNDYYVKSDANGWKESKSTTDTRRELTNMPVVCDRIEDGTFRFSFIDWKDPLVGDATTNPTPSFAHQKLTDIFFYKNRLGLASEQNVVLSETADYYNFYIKSVLSLLDTDPIDVAIASTTASKIRHVKPFQGELFIFTEDAQYILKSEGVTSPKSVNIVPLSNYPMASRVTPKVSGDSLFFVSKTAGRQQLREYKKSDFNLTVKGHDLNVTTPTYMEEPITSIEVNDTMGAVICASASNLCYVYLYKDAEGKRQQSSWSKWKFYEGHPDITAGSFEYGMLENSLLVIFKTSTDYVYNTVELTKNTIGTGTDVPLYPADDLYPSATLYPSGTSYSDDDNLGTYGYKAEIQLPKWYPKPVNDMGSPKDKILMKKMTIEGDGRFDADVYRTDYKTTFSKTHFYTTIQDLDIHVNSRVDRCEIYISDSTTADFTIRSVTMEGLFQPTSQQRR